MSATADCADSATATSPVVRDRARLAQGLYDCAAGRILAARPGAGGLLRRASAAQPQDAPAHAALALLHHRAGRREAAARRLDRAAGAASRASRRSRSHVDAIAAVVTGQKDAPRRVGAHLSRYPGDALLAQEGAELLTWEGGADPRPARRAFLAALAPHYEADGWFFGELAFDVAEAGGPAAAAAMARRVLARDPGNAPAAHALVHAHFEAGEHASGIAFLRTWLPGYSPLGAEHSHLVWHLALFELRLGHEAAAMSVYRRALDPSAVPGRRLCDSASFLWRRHLARPEAALPWGPVRALARRESARATSAFNDVHVAMAFAGSGDGDGMGRLLRRLREQADAGEGVAGEVTLPLSLGLDAYGRGEFAAAARHLEGAAGAVPRLGGSNAQRAVFADTLTAARRRATRP